MQLTWQIYANNQWQNKIALRDHSQGVAFSWLELNQAIDEKAVFLQRLSLKQASLALSGKNSFDLLCFYLAGLQLDIAVLCLNPALTKEKITELCNQHKISYWIDCDKNFSLTEFGYSHFPNQALTLTLTSGSTGFPKAVVHSLQNHLDNAKGVCQLMQFNHQNSWLLSLPLFHVSGQGIVWRWLLQGAELHLPSDNFYYDVLQATHVSLVPTQAQRLLQYLQQNTQSAVKTQAILLGGASIPEKLCQKLTALDIKVYSGYGMTEMASTVFAKQNLGDMGVGQPLLGREFKIVNHELWLKGAGLALGYWQQNKILPLTNQQGWLQTKDKANWNGKELHILGRLDNMFISGGENIQPEQIETVILQNPKVKQVIVIPKPDQEFGQRPVAFISFNSMFSDENIAELQYWLIDKIEKFKQPIAYFSLEAEISEQSIKPSRHLLKAKLEQILNKQDKNIS